MCTRNSIGDSLTSPVVGYTYGVRLGAHHSRMATAPDSPTALPLAGIRILELANVVAGPSIGAYLSDFGAEVLKVERPGDGDASRHMGETVGSRSAWWLCIGRNKESAWLDLKRDRDRQRFLELVREADAVVESFRPGVLERLGVGPQQMHEVNPRLIVVRISAFGQTGPYAERPGFGTLAEAFSGLAAISGFPIGRRFCLQLLWLTRLRVCSEPGLFWPRSTTATFTKVPGRRSTSRSTRRSSACWPLPTIYHHIGSVQRRQGSRLPFSSPRNVYQTRDGEYFAVSGTAPSAAEQIVRLVGGEELLADRRFASHSARAQHADELDQIVGDWVGEHDLADVEAPLSRARTPREFES